MAYRLTANNRYFAIQGQSNLARQAIGMTVERRVVSDTFVATNEPMYMSQMMGLTSGATSGESSSVVTRVMLGIPSVPITTNSSVYTNPHLVFQRETNNPLDDDALHIIFQAQNDASENIAMGKWIYSMTDVSDGAEAGKAAFLIKQAGTVSPQRIFEVQEDNLRIVDDKKLSFGTEDDMTFEYDEDGLNTLLMSHTSDTYDDVVDVLALELQTSGTVANNFGAGISVRLEDAGNVEEHASIDFVMTNTVTGQEDCDIVFRQSTYSEVQESLRLASDRETTAADNIQFNASTLATTGILDVMKLRLNTNGTAVDNLGLSLSMQIENDAGEIEESAAFQFQLTDVSNGAEDCDINIRQRIDTTMVTRLALDADGAVTILGPLAFTNDDTTDGIVNVLTLTHSSSDNNATVADGAAISFQLENDADTVEEWASIDVFSASIANGAEEGDIVLRQMVAGGVADKLLLNSDGLSVLTGSLEIANGSAFGTTALVVDNDDTDQIALDIQAENIDANVLQITANAITTSNVLDINSSSITTGAMIDVAVTDSQTTGYLIDLWTSAASLTSGGALRAWTVATTDGLATQSGRVNTFRATRTELGAGDPNDSYDLVDIERHTRTEGTNVVAYTSSGSVLHVRNLVTDADLPGTITDTVSVLELIQDADSIGNSINIDHDGESVAIVLVGDQTTADVIDLSVAGLTTGTVIDISDLDAITTGKALHIDATGVTHSDGILAHIDSGSTAISATGRLLLVDHTGATTTAQGAIAEIASAATDNTTVFKVTASAALAAGIAQDISVVAMTTGTALDIGDLDALTTGAGLNIASGSEAIAAGELATIGLTSSGSTITAKSGSLVSIASSRTELAAAATADDYDVLSVTRTNITDTAGTLTAAGSVVRLENVATQTAGTLTDTATVLELVQDAQSTGNSINIDHNGTGAVIETVAEVTTADLFGATLAAKISGSVFDIDVTTSTLTASTIIYDTVVSTDHDGVNTDTLVGAEVAWSGAVPNDTLDSSMRLHGSVYSGTWGSGTTEGGTLDGFKADFTGATINGSAANFYGFHFDSTGITNSSSNEVAGAKLVLDGFAEAINIDADTTDHFAGNIINIDLGVNSASVNMVNANIDIGTILTAGEIVRGTYLDINESVVNETTSQIFGSEYQMTAFATSINDLIGLEINFDGTKSATADVWGIHVNSDSLTVNDSGATFAGLLVDASGATNTSSSTFYGVNSVIPTQVGVALTRAAGRFTDGTNTATVGDGSMGLSATGINDEKYYRCFDFDDAEDGAQLDTHQTDFNVQWAVGGTNHAAGGQLLQVENNGNLELTTAAAGNDSEVVTNISPIRVDSNPIFEVRFKTDSVTATENVVYMGLTETATPVANGNFEAVTDDFILVGIDSAEANPANIRLVTDDTGGAAQTGTIEDLGVAVTVNVYCTVRVDCTDTEQPRVWVNNTGAAIAPSDEIAAGSITGTIQAAISMYPVIFVETIGGGAAQLTVDYFKIWQDR